MKPSFTHEDVALWMPKLEGIARELAFVPGSEDDLVQDTWLEVLQSKPSVVRHPLGWMRVIMRRRSTKLRLATQRRRDCEELAARGEALDEGEVERASATALVLTELEQLDSTYREALRMRFLEECSYREIAERCGRSSETVRSQVHRGLAQLRERLDRRMGSRELWAGLLASQWRFEPEAALAREAAHASTPRPLAPAEPRSWLGVATGSVGLVGAALLLSGLAFWLWPVGSRSSGLSPGVVLSSAEGGRGIVSAAPREAGRVVAGADAEPGISPAPAPPPAKAPDLPADRTRLVLIVEDAAGRALPDARAEVYGAGIRSLHDGPVGKDGRLVLDIGVDDLFDEFPLVGSITLAASTEALTRCEMVVVDMEEGRERRLRLPLDRPSVSLHGRVTDDEGRAIAGAIVETQVVAIERRELEPGVGLAPLLLWATTDEEGEYSLQGVVPERHQVVVSKPGFVLLATEVTPRGESTRADFALGRGGIVAGFLTHEDGRPASGARVWVGTPSARQRILPEARADEDGFFLMSGLGDGEWEVFACDPRDPRLFAWTRVEARDGEEAPFEGVLRPTTGVRVRVLDRAGAPFADAGVVVTPTDPRSTWSALASTDASGRAQLLHVPDVPLDVRVYPTELRGGGDGAAFRSGVRSGEAELDLRMGDLVGQVEAGEARVRGILLQSDGVPLTGAVVHAVPSETAASPVLSPDGDLLLDDAGIGKGKVKADGRFVVDGLSPGEHRLMALSRLPECAGTLDLGRCTLLPGETFELGTRRAPEGQPVRFDRRTPGEILLSADLGPFWQRWMKLESRESLELRILAGRYWVGTREAGARFSVPGQSVIVVPE